MAYAILIYKRLKSPVAIQKVGEHVTRQVTVANADPAREARALRVMGDAWSAVSARLAEANVRPRATSVLAWEALMSASPDYFRPQGGPAGAWDAERLDAWWPRAFAWVNREWGDGNVVGAYLHLDESTPHIHALCVPIDPCSARLCSAHWFKNREAWSAQHDRHAQAMGGLGLERGSRGSRASHLAIRTWYAQMQAPVAQVPSPQVDCPPLLFSAGARQEWSRQESERLERLQHASIDCLSTQARSAAEANRRRREIEATLTHLTRRHDVERQEAELYRRYHGGSDRLTLRESAALFPLQALQQAGVHVPGMPGGTTRVTEGRDQDQAQPGNALDLIMRLTGQDRLGALRWLAGRRGPHAAEQLAIATALDEARDQARLASRQAQAPEFLRERVQQALTDGGGQEPGFLALQRRLHQHGFSLRRSALHLEVRERFSGLVVEGVEADLLPRAREANRVHEQPAFEPGTGPRAGEPGMP